jgi:hypothetical protein
MLSIAAEISEIGGVTTAVSSQIGRSRSWDNTVLTSLAEQAVRAHLARDLDEALTLVVPAFARYNLLPTPETGPGEQLTAASAG